MTDTSQQAPEDTPELNALIRAYDGPEEEWEQVLMAFTCDLERRLQAAEEALYRFGHDQPCYYCAKPCNSLAANPNEWPIPLCHADDPGKVKWHHIGCVSERLHQLAAAQAQGKLSQDGWDNCVACLCDAEDKLEAAQAENAKLNAAVADAKSELLYGIETMRSTRATMRLGDAALDAAQAEIEWLKNTLVRIDKNGTYLKNVTYIAPGAHVVSASEWAEIERLKGYLAHEILRTLEKVDEIAALKGRLSDVLAYCDIDPEGETAFEQAIIKARAALAAEPPA